MTTATITPKTDREKALLSLVMAAGEKGVARMDIESKLKISKPTVEKLIKGLGLKKVRQERRKEFFGVPEGAKVEGVEANANPDAGKTGEGATGRSGQYRLPKGGNTPSGAFQTSQGRSDQAGTAKLSDDERATLVKIANALLAR